MAEHSDAVPSQPPLRLGIAGGGRAFQRLYLPALRRVPGLQLAAVADTEPARLEAVPAPTARFSSIEAMLDRAALDAVAIASPPRLHVTHARLVADRGLPILLEKPVALSLEELEPLTQAAHLITPSFSRRYWTAYRRLQPQLAGARVVTFGIRASATEWAAFDPQPVGLAHDFLPHLVDLARFLARIDPAEVTARQCAKGVEIRLSGRDGRGAVCRAIGGTPYREAVSLDGMATTIDAAGRPGAILSRLLARAPNDVAGFAAMLNDWAAHLRGATPSHLPTFEHGWASVAIIEAGLQSLARSRPVDVRAQPS